MKGVLLTPGYIASFHGTPAGSSGTFCQKCVFQLLALSRHHAPGHYKALLTDGWNSMNLLLPAYDPHSPNPDPQHLTVGDYLTLSRVQRESNQAGRYFVVLDYSVILQEPGASLDITDTDASQFLATSIDKAPAEESPPLPQEEPVSAPSAWGNVWAPSQKGMPVVEPPIAIATKRPKIPKSALPSVEPPKDAAPERAPAQPQSPEPMADVATEAASLPQDLPAALVCLAETILVPRYCSLSSQQAQLLSEVFSDPPQQLLALLGKISGACEESNAT